MRAQEFITEAVGGNYLYHGAPNGKTILAILKSGFIKTQEQFDFDRNPNDDSDAANPPVISLSRDKLLRFPAGDAVAQFVIDKDALRRAGIITKPMPGGGYGRIESEERAYKDIPLKAPYVVALQYDPALKIPKAVLDIAQQAGIKIAPWVPVIKRATMATSAAIPLATRYTNPAALYIQTDDHGPGPTNWSIGYKTSSTSADIIQPYYGITDASLIKNAFAAIKDRIASGLSFKDLLPAEQYNKNWAKGTHEIKPGDRGYK